MIDNMMITLPLLILFLPLASFTILIFFVDISIILTVNEICID